ncbi:MAG: VOC family protein, partial [Bacillota bacterium]
MIDHTGVVVSDFDRSKRFYSAALKPIGFDLLAEFPAAITGH